MNPYSLHNWKGRAVAAYQELHAQASASARLDLAAQMQNLIGRAFDLQAIYVDDDTQIAIVKVDGVLFRRRRQQLVVVRPCPCCGLGQYESPPLTSIAELGFVLDAWQPPCANCQAEDPQAI